MLPLLLVDCSGRAEALVVEAQVPPVVQVVQVVAVLAAAVVVLHELTLRQALAA